VEDASWKFWFDNHFVLWIHKVVKSCFIAEKLTRLSLDTITVRSGNRISVGARFSATVQTGPWGLPSLQYNGYRVFSGSKADGTWRWPPTSSSAEVKERVEVYLCPPPYGPSWPVLEWTLPLLLLHLVYNNILLTSYVFRLKRVTIRLVGRNM